MLTTSGWIVLIVGFLAILATISTSIMTAVLLIFMKRKKD